MINRIKQHMLFLEDEPGVRRNVADRLREEFPEYEVDDVESVKEAKNVFARRRKQGYVTRLVVVDEVLQNRARGSEFLKYLHKRFPGVKKIMLSANASLEDLSRAINEGHLDRYVLKKDFDGDPNCLFKVIRETLTEEENFICQAVTEMVTQAVEEGAADQIVLASTSKRLIPPSELLQHITAGTPVGREHMKQFSKFIYDALQNPSLFLKQMRRVGRLRERRRPPKARQQRIDRLGTRVLVPKTRGV